MKNKKAKENENENESESNKQIVENVFEVEEDDTAVKNYVEIDYDLYCFTICALLSPDKYSPITLLVLFKKCMIIFVIQFLLTTFFLFHLFDNNK